MMEGQSGGARGGAAAAAKGSGGYQQQRIVFIPRLGPRRSPSECSRASIIQPTTLTTMRRQTALLMGDPLLSGEAKGIFWRNEFLVDYLCPPGASSIVVPKKMS